LTILNLSLFLWKETIIPRLDTYYASGMAVFRRARQGARRFSLKKKSPYQRRKPFQSRALTSPFYVPVAGPVNGFPEVLRTSLRYQDQYTLTSSSGSAAQWLFRLNSLFDPDLTGVGHQPLYFDQLSGIYQYYRIRSTRMHVTFLPLTDDTELTTTGPYEVGVGANSTSTFSSTLNTVAEQNNSKVALLPRDKSAQPVSLTLTYQPKRDLGVAFTDDTVSASIGGSPAATYYGAIFAADLNLTSGAVKAVVTLTFDAEFFQQNGIAGS